MAWAKSGSDTLTSTSNTLDISVDTPVKSNQFLSHTFVGGTWNQLAYRLGNTTIDTGSNYSERYSRDGGAEGTATSQADLDLWANTSTPQHDQFTLSYIVNISSKEKLLITFGMDRNTAGAANVPRRIEAVGKWANTSNQFDQIRIWEKNSDVFASDSNLSALGSELTPASATTIETGSIYIDTDINGRWWYDGTNWNATNISN